MSKFILTVALLGNFIFSKGQVGINTNTPDSSSALDVVSTNSGVLIPRLTTTQRNEISNPANGLLIFDTTKQCLSQQIGTTTSPKWTCLGGAASRFFYLPSVNIDISTTGEHTLNLYDEYATQFSGNYVASSPNAVGIPYYQEVSDLDFYVTKINDAPISNLSINEQGLLTYTVEATTASDCAFVNVVVVVK